MHNGSVLGVKLSLFALNVCESSIRIMGDTIYALTCPIKNDFLNFERHGNFIDFITLSLL